MSKLVASHRFALGIGAALIAALIWGGWFPVSRLAVTTVLGPADLALLRYLVAGTVLIPVAFRLGLRAGKAGWWGAFGIALTVGAPYPYLLAVGLEFAPAAHVAIFVPGVFPALTLIASACILGDRVTPRRLAGLLLTLVAVALVGWTVFESAGMGRLQGYLIFLVCAAMWTAYTLIVRYAEISAVHATAIIGVLTLILYLPPYLLFSERQLFDLPLAELSFQILYHGFLGGFLSMFLYSYSVNALGPPRAAIFGALVPCFAALLAVPIVGESVGWRELLAIAAASLGIVLVTGAGGLAHRRASKAGQ